MKIQVKKVKKFDTIELLSGPQIGDYLLLKKGENMCRIYYMNGKSTFCLINEYIDVKRDVFYSLTHKVYTNQILKILQ